VSVLATWTDCATEGTCSFSGTRQVRYGANGQYAHMTFTSSTACSNAVFGDPIHIVQKTCSDSGIAR
jgi:serine protease